MFYLVNEWASFILENGNLYVEQWRSIIGADNTSKGTKLRLIWVNVRKSGKSQE